MTTLYTCNAVGKEKFVVKTVTENPRQVNTVDLSTGECTCRHSIDFGVVCCHGIVAMHNNKMTPLSKENVEKYWANWAHAWRYKKAYSAAVALPPEIVPGTFRGFDEDRIFPPLIKKKRGRSKNKRYKRGDCRRRTKKRLERPILNPEFEQYAEAPATKRSKPTGEK